MEGAWSELGLKPPRVTAVRGGVEGEVPCAWLCELARGRLAPVEDFPPLAPRARVFFRAYAKRNGKALPLGRVKASRSRPMSYSQLLQYAAQTNRRSLWRESYETRVAALRDDSNSERATIDVVDRDAALKEAIARLYGCEPVSLGADASEDSERARPPPNVLPAVCVVETERSVFVVHHRRPGTDVASCLAFSPALLESTYARRLFVVYQLLQTVKSMNDRGLNLGEIGLQDVYLTENLWIQIVPSVLSNVACVDVENVVEQTGLKRTDTPGDASPSRERTVSLEKLCDLWANGRLSNLDYLIRLNSLAGREAGNPAAHHVVPWVTDFSSRCGERWRDLTKSKYRLTKGDRQLDLTYDVSAKDCRVSSSASHQIPHHVSDVLSDITYYVYMARRTPKATLCQYVRHNWVPAEYPTSIQRMQEWTPDECIPEFFTDPSVFRSIHEDLPDLEIPAWATCVEDFIAKHREALESVQVSESLHHWIDLTFGYKLSGNAAIKAKNVCLSLVDGHTELNRAGPVQLFSCPHPARLSRNSHSWGEKLPPRIIWHKERKSVLKANDSSDDGSEDDSNVPQHMSSLHVPRTYKHSDLHSSRHKSSSRSRRHSKKCREYSVSPGQSKERNLIGHHHFKVQKSEMGKNVIYLPKEYNPVYQLVAMENLFNFKLKTFYSQNLHDPKSETPPKVNSSKSYTFSSHRHEANSFTNQMFEQQNYYKKYNKLESKETFLKDKKDRMFNTRFVTSLSLFKETALVNRRKDMQVIGCLIVELFLYEKLRPLATKSSGSFSDRYKTCRLVLKNNFYMIPKCVRYVVCLLLQVNDDSMLSNEKHDAIHTNFPCVSEKGLPAPSALQLLQPLLMNHLFPFTYGFQMLYTMAMVLHEYYITEKELSIICSFECNGQECLKYHEFDKTKFLFIQKISESKINSYSLHLEKFLNEINSYSQFDSIDLFLPFFIELLQNKNTCILAAWYLFDPVAKALGPMETNKKLLKLVLNLYDEHTVKSDDINLKFCNKKSVKLYHNIFLLQLIVRFGLKCFLENFISHLVEAVGGYKDITTIDSLTHSHSFNNKSKLQTSIKNLTYCDETLKVDVMSPDTSYGSENITPSTEREGVSLDKSKKLPADMMLENEVFHFENDGNKEVFSPRTVAEIDSSKCCDFNKTKIKCLLEEMDLECSSPNLDLYLDHAQAVEATESIYGDQEDNVRMGLEQNIEAIDSVNKDDCDSKLELSSPSADTVPPQTNFTSYLQFKDKYFSASDRPAKNIKNASENGPMTSSKDYKISEMTFESLIWLSHRLGPVLTCKFITRNLLKMLTLCYIGQDNLMPCKEKCDQGLDSLCIASGRLVGDKNAAKVIECLTSIVGLYGEQLILLQYFPHMGDLIASCRKRISGPLEGGLIACLQLLRYLVPFLSDVKLMEQLQDIILKNILHPTVRLISSTRSTFPSGYIARDALARKFLETLYVISIRIGSEMTRKHLCVPALQRFCVSFDKAYGIVQEISKSDTKHLPKKNQEQCEEQVKENQNRSADEGTSFVEICRDGTTTEWKVSGDNIIQQGDTSGDLSSSPFQFQEKKSGFSALQEIQNVFTSELAHQLFTSFTKFIGEETMRRSLNNYDLLKELTKKYEHSTEGEPPVVVTASISSNNTDNQMENFDANSSSFKKSDSVPCRRSTVDEETSNSNSFGSGVFIIGNRIDVQNDPNEENVAISDPIQSEALNLVSFKMENSNRSNRHLRGDWLMYWEHEIGRPDNDNKFNLKQIKLQTFSSHTHSVRNILCLDNENSFMTGSKDKTVKLWSLRNSGDGSMISPCQWTYTGHRKGILSLSFLESLRLAVSTDSIVHIWDPYVESLVAQLDMCKTAPVSIVKAMAPPSPLILAATTDTILKIIDAKTCSFTHELKVTYNASTFIRCICTSPTGKWIAVGLATGHLSILDLRTGLLVNHWKGHDGEVLQLVTVNESYFISSSLDQTVSVWSTVDGKMKFQLKGSTEPVHCLATYYDELISGTTNNRIGVHTSVDQDAGFSSTKLRSDTFKGVLTSMAVLPLNKMLLLGSESGVVSLLC